MIHTAKSTLIAAIVLLVATLSACGLLPVEEQPPAPPLIRAYERTTYDLAAVTVGDIVDSLRISFKYTPARQQRLSFGQSGIRLGGIYVEQGEAVVGGQLLAELEHADLLAQIEQSEFAAERTQLSIDALDDTHIAALKSLSVRQRGGEDVADEIEGENTSYRNQHSILILQLEQTKRKLSEQREQVEQRKIYAPFDGTVTYIRLVKDGNFMSSEGEAFITVSDKSTSVFTATGADAARLSVGDSITLSLGSESHMSTVLTSGLQDGIHTTVAQLDQPIAGIEDNTTAVLHYVLERRDAVLRVPSDAIKRADGKNFVYRLNDEGVRYMNFVETGLSAGGYVEILSGLSEGDEVIAK